MLVGLCRPSQGVFVSRAVFSLALLKRLASRALKVPISLVACVNVGKRTLPEWSSSTRIQRWMGVPDDGKVDVSWLSLVLLLQVFCGG